MVTYCFAFTSGRCKCSWPWLKVRHTCTLDPLTTEQSTPEPHAEVFFLKQCKYNMENIWYETIATVHFFILGWIPDITELLPCTTGYLPFDFRMKFLDITCFKYSLGHWASKLVFMPSTFNYRPAYQMMPMP